MKNFIKRGALLALIAFSAAAMRCYCQDASQAEVVTTKLSNTVYLLQTKIGDGTYGGNVVASVGPDGILLVDAEYSAVSDKLRDALKKLNGGTAIVKYVIDTHWHRDHSEGNKTFGHEATIIAQENVRDLLSHTQTMFGKPMDPYPLYALPTITFVDSLTLHFNGEDIKVLHLPNAHTNGDSIVQFVGSNVTATGDIYTGPVFPYVDLEHGGNVVQLDAAVQKLLTLISPSTVIVPGHRRLSNREDIVLYERMLAESISCVRQGISEHKTLSQIQAAGLPPGWKSWEWVALMTPQWLQYVYASLGGT